MLFWCCQSADASLWHIEDMKLSLTHIFVSYGLLVALNWCKMTVMKSLGQTDRKCRNWTSMKSQQHVDAHQRISVGSVFSVHYTQILYIGVYIGLIGEKNIVNIYFKNHKLEHISYVIISAKRTSLFTVAFNTCAVIHTNSRVYL